MKSTIMFIAVWLFNSQYSFCQISKSDHATPRDAVPASIAQPANTANIRAIEAASPRGLIARTGNLTTPKLPMSHAKTPVNLPPEYQPVEAHTQSLIASTKVLRENTVALQTNTLALQVNTQAIEENLASVRRNAQLRGAEVPLASKQVDVLVKTKMFLANTLAKASEKAQVQNKPVLAYAPIRQRPIAAGSAFNSLAKQPVSAKPVLAKALAIRQQPQATLPVKIAAPAKQPVAAHAEKMPPKPIAAFSGIENNMPIAMNMPKPKTLDRISRTDQIPPQSAIPAVVVKKTAIAANAVKTNTKEKISRTEQIIPLSVIPATTEKKITIAANTSKPNTSEKISRPEQIIPQSEIPAMAEKKITIAANTPKTNTTERISRPEQIIPQSVVPATTEKKMTIAANTPKPNTTERISRPERIIPQPATPALEKKTIIAANTTKPNTTERISRPEQIIPQSSTPAMALNKTTIIASTPKPNTAEKISRSERLIPQPATPSLEKKTITAVNSLKPATMERTSRPDQVIPQSVVPANTMNKTSIASKEGRNVKLIALTQLPLVDQMYDYKRHDSKRFPIAFRSGLKEGDAVTTEGYLHVVATEDSGKQNETYCLQITVRSQYGDSCFIVKIPSSDLSGMKMSASAINAKRFIRDQLVKGKAPSVGGNIVRKPVYVSVTGELAYDDVYAGAIRGRNHVYPGKRGMHSYTAWQMSQVSRIEFTMP